MRQTVLSLVFFLCIASLSFAQSKKAKTTPQPAQQEGASNSLSPYYNDESQSATRSKPTKKSRAERKRTAKNDFKVTHDSEKQYYARVEAVAKARRKTEKIMQKPQYSDPMYFGHKRPPRKRPVHKMKFCKECGIKH